VIDRGEIILVEEKHALIEAPGKDAGEIGLKQKRDSVPAGPFALPLDLSPDGMSLSYTQNGEATSRISGWRACSRRSPLREIDFQSVTTDRSSLEDIFVDLVGKSR